ncbi:hypothetical protein ACJ73_06866 [Blastomyces percursus]|uniref:MADS-box domain-containing protein n=1 Tax=Blastomyces percursus TaxID=1658174 RepID=A0A1J9PZN7_9EURO|nr:hypothetical protein ACJ73_06866 [Blastomyces percursus]
MSTPGNRKNRLKRKEHYEKKDQEKWKKRKQTCYRKFMELSLFCEADVYALIHRHGQVYTLKATLRTTNQESFPPPEAALGGLKGKPEVADFQQRLIKEPLQSKLAAMSRESVRAGGKKQFSSRDAIRPPVWVTSPLKEKFLEE